MFANPINVPSAPIAPGKLTEGTPCTDSGARMVDRARILSKFTIFEIDITVWSVWMDSRQRHHFASGTCFPKVCVCRNASLHVFCHVFLFVSTLRLNLLDRLVI